MFDKGQLKESGKPADLLGKPDSMFAEMARDAPGLRAAAAANADEEAASSGFGASTDDNSQINEFL